ncbi:MAG TPA: hypothetical protein VFF73_03500 [Planctomycetota bacterium]|nr:hypothetical protein [Planctomycetota bacterium]
MAPLARAQDSDADDPARMRGELISLRQQVNELKARLAQVEQTLASIAAQTSDATRPAIDKDLGFVFPGMPRGSSFGAPSPGDLARTLHHAATSGEHDVEKLLAFSRTDFWVPDALWAQAGKGLKAVAGTPTRYELELALSALKSAGPQAAYLNARPARDLQPKDGAGLVEVWDMDVVVDSRTDRYRLTAVKVGGRWFAASLISIAAEEDARAFLDDLVASQRAYHADRQGRYARNLHELAGARDIQDKPNIKRAGLTFPLAARLDRLDKDRFSWSGNDLKGPLYTFKLTGDEKTGWSASAEAVSPSYWSFTVTVAAGGKPEFKRTRGNETPDPGSEPRRREGQPEGE